MSQEKTSQPHVFVILGATGGIGSEVAKQLHACGHKLLLASRSEEKLNALAKQLPGAKHQVTDVTKSAEVDRAADAAIHHFGRIDGLVNCVGSFALKPLHLITDEAFAYDIAVNLSSSFFAVRAAVQRMEKGRGGSVVLLSSAAARHGIPNHEGIAAAKGGVTGLMLSAAATYAPDNIRVNAVAPGLIKTQLTRSVVDNEAVAQASAAMHALRRTGEPDQVARLICFLLDPQNDFITGQTFGIDGGLATLRPKR